MITLSHKAVACYQGENGQEWARKRTDSNDTLVLSDGFAKIMLIVLPLSGCHSESVFIRCLMSLALSRMDISSSFVKSSRWTKSRFLGCPAAAFCCPDFSAATAAVTRSAGRPWGLCITALDDSCMLPAGTCIIRRQCGEVGRLLRVALRRGAAAADREPQG